MSPPPSCFTPSNQNSSLSECLHGNNNNFLKAEPFCLSGDSFCWAAPSLDLHGLGSPSADCFYLLRRYYFSCSPPGSGSTGLFFCLFPQSLCECAADWRRTAFLCEKNKFCPVWVFLSRWTEMKSLRRFSTLMT